MHAKYLEIGDEVRVVAPARSMGILSKELFEGAFKRLVNLGLKVTFSKNISEIDEFNSSLISSRVADLHEAFSDSSVKSIISCALLKRFPRRPIKSAREPTESQVISS